MKKYTSVLLVLLIALFLAFSPAKASAYSCTATVLTPSVIRGESAKVRVDVDITGASEPVYVWAKQQNGWSVLPLMPLYPIVQTIDGCTPDALLASSCSDPNLFSKVSGSSGSVTINALTNTIHTDLGSQSFNIFCSTNKPLTLAAQGTGPNNAHEVFAVPAPYTVVGGSNDCQLLGGTAGTAAGKNTGNVLIRSLFNGATWPPNFSLAKSGTATFSIKNSGTVAASLATDSPSAGVTVSLGTTTLAPGASTSFTVNFSATADHETFNLTSSCGGSTHTYPLVGEVPFVCTGTCVSPPPPPPAPNPYGVGEGDFPMLVGGGPLVITEGETITRDVVVGNPNGRTAPVKISGGRSGLPPGVNVTFNPAEGVISTGMSFQTKATFKADGLVLAGTYNYQLGITAGPVTVSTKLSMTTKNKVIPGPVSLIAKPKSLALDPFRLPSKPLNILSKVNGGQASAILALADTTGNNPSNINNTSPQFTSLSLIPSKIQSGQTVPFTWSATDINNDDLLWGVDWGDESGASASVICPSFSATGTGQNWNHKDSHIWTNSGSYTVTVFVSDCKSTTARNSFTVNVGNGATNPSTPPTIEPSPEVASGTINTLRHSIANMLNMRLESPGDPGRLAAYPSVEVDPYTAQAVGNRVMSVKSWTNPVMILDKSKYKAGMGARYYSLADPMNPVRDFSKDKELYNVPAGDFGPQMYPWSIAYSRDGRYEISNQWNNGTWGSTPEYPVSPSPTGYTGGTGIPFEGDYHGDPVDIFQSNSRVYFTYLNSGGVTRLDGIKKSAPYLSAGGSTTFDWIYPELPDTAPNIPKATGNTPTGSGVNTTVMAGVKDYVAVLTGLGGWRSVIPNKLSIYAPTENDPVAEINIANASTSTGTIQNLTSFVTSDVQYVMFTAGQYLKSSPLGPNDPKRWENLLYVYKFNPATSALTKVVEGIKIVGEIGGGLTQQSIAGIRVGNKDGVIVLLDDDAATINIMKPAIYMFPDLSAGTLKDVFKDAGYSIRSNQGAMSLIASLNVGVSTYVYLNTQGINPTKGIAVIKFDPSGINVTPVSSSSDTSSSKITHTLRRGASGPEVVALQEFLNENGYDVGAADGDFGPKTEAAVIRFQIANGLKGDGVVGPLTRALMN